MNFKEFVVLFICLVFSVSVFGAPAASAPKALVVGTPNYSAMFEAWLNPLGYTVTKLDQDNGLKNWKEKGYVLPKIDQLRQYKLIVICPLINTVASCKEDIVQYIKDGGNYIILYNSLMQTRDKTGDLGYGICGFDKLSQINLKPYPQSGDMLHKLVYTPKLGKKKFEKKYLLTYYAGDLIDAEPLIVNPELKGMALATVTKVGKGQFIFYGGENKEIFLDILAACGLSK